MTPHSLTSRAHSLIALSLGCSFLHHLGLESPKFPTPAPEELVEHFVSCMRPLGFTSEIASDTTLLQPTASPAVLRWVCRRVDGRLPRPAGRSKGPQSIPDK